MTGLSRRIRGIAPVVPPVRVFLWGARRHDGMTRYVPIWRAQAPPMWKSAPLKRDFLFVKQRCEYRGGAKTRHMISMVTVPQQIEATGGEGCLMARCQRWCEYASVLGYIKVIQYKQAIMGNEPPKLVRLCTNTAEIRLNGLFPSDGIAPKF